jgi:hypothetical protein
LTCVGSGVYYDKDMASLSTLARHGILCALLALGFWSAPPAQAQLIVFELEFQRKDGFNDVPFDGKYLVAPVPGGDASFVLTAGSGSGRRIVVANSAGRYFRAVTNKREVKWVAQAQLGAGGGQPVDPGAPPDLEDEFDPAPPPPPSGNSSNDLGQGGVPGTTTGAFLAIGDARRNTPFQTPLLTFETSIATELKGRVVGASSQVEDETSKRLGYATISDWKLKWSDSLSKEVNSQDLTLAEATTYLAQKLQETSGPTPPPIIITPLRFATPSPLAANGLVGSSYTFQLAAQGGNPPYSFAAVNPAQLPTNLVVQPSGLITTTQGNFLIQSGVFNFTVRVTDSSSPQQATQRVYTLTILPRILPETPVVANRVVLPAATVNQAYAQAITAAGAVGPLTWNPTAGTNLPAGLVFQADGNLVGTPTEVGNFTLNVQVIDSGTGLTQTKQFSIEVNP